MGFFSFGRDKMKDATNAVSGNKDFLEGLCAATAWTAAAEGGIDDQEYDKVLTGITGNSAINGSYSASEVEKVFNRMAAKTKTRQGKSELKTEIEQVIGRDKSGKMGEAIVYTCLDVADEGGISDAEEKVMKEIAQICNVNYEKLKG